MASLRFPLALFFVLTGLSHAASSLLSLQTDYSGPPAPAINTSNTQSRNLSNLSDLTPGQTIQLQFIPDSPVEWSGSLFYPAGDLDLTRTATIEITVGEYTLSYTDTWNLKAVGAPESGSGGVFGTDMPGPPAMMHVLDLPWGTDLSNTTITLRDLSTFSGGNFGTSSMSLSGTLRTISVPEPSTLLMAGLFPTILLLRRRGRTA